MEDKIMIFTDGGVIQGIYSTNKDIQVVVIDHDVEDLEEEFIVTAQHIEDSEDILGKVWTDIDYRVYCTEDAIPFTYRRNEK